MKSIRIADMTQFLIKQTDIVDENHVIHCDMNVNIVELVINGKFSGREKALID